MAGGEKAKFGPNLNEFVRRFDSVTTDGQGVYVIYFLIAWYRTRMLFPVSCVTNIVCYSNTYSGPSWLKNLYFAYLLTLRAIVKAEPYWKVHQFYTGNEREDQETKSQVFRIIQAAK